MADVLFVVKQDWIVGDVFVGCLNGFLECLKKFFEGGLWVMFLFIVKQDCFMGDVFALANQPHKMVISLSEFILSSLEL